MTGAFSGGNYIRRDECLSVRAARRCKRAQGVVIGRVPGVARGALCAGPLGPHRGHRGPRAKALKYQYWRRVYMFPSPTCLERAPGEANIPPVHQILAVPLVVVFFMLVYFSSQHPAFSISSTPPPPPVRLLCPTNELRSVVLAPTGVPIRQGSSLPTCTLELTLHWLMMKHIPADCGTAVACCLGAITDHFVVTHP